MPRKKPEQSDDPCCGRCEYFVAEAKEDDGDCRRMPPVAIFDGDRGGWMFPTVDWNVWCGEFRRRVS